jgi:glycosyltransferase involved in cell wall biosynthesis
MDNKPTISIIMPVYNSEQYLAESIDSIIAQTYTDWELIVIDDSSTDGSRAIAQGYTERDARIRIVSNTHEKGLAGALNCGLSHVRGAYIARADGDDINVPERLQIEYNYLQSHPSIDIVGSWYETFGNNKSPKVRKHPSHSVVLAWKYLSNTYFCHPTILFRKKVLDTVSQYPVVICEDFAFLSSIIHTHRGHNIPQVLLRYREHTTNYSFTKAESIKQSVFETYKKNYAFYNGAPAFVNAFYRFHAQYRISVKAFFPLIRESIRIGRKILQNYNLHKNIRAIIMLSATIKIYFLKAITNSVVRTILGR